MSDPDYGLEPLDDTDLKALGVFAELVVLSPPTAPLGEWGAGLARAVELDRRDRERWWRNREAELRRGWVTSWWGDPTDPPDEPADEQSLSP